MIKAFFARYPLWLWCVFVVWLLILVIWVVSVVHERNRAETMEPLADRLQQQGIQVELPPEVAIDRADESDSQRGFDQDLLPISQVKAPAVDLQNSQNSTTQSGHDVVASVTDSKTLPPAAPAEKPVSPMMVVKDQPEPPMEDAEDPVAESSLAQTKVAVDDDGQGTASMPVEVKEALLKSDAPVDSKLKRESDVPQASIEAKPDESVVPVQNKPISVATQQTSVKSTKKPSEVTVKTKSSGYYTVQVASYQTQVAAEKMRDRLVAQHFLAHVVHDGSHWRVEIGHASDKKLLIGLQAGVDRAVGVQSWLRYVDHQPESKE